MGGAPTKESTRQALIYCLERQIRDNQSIKLPFAPSDRGQTFQPIDPEAPIESVPIDALYLDLPLLTKQNVFSGKIRSEKLENDVTKEQQPQESNPPVNIAAIDQIGRGQVSEFKEVICRIGEELKPAAKLVVRGDPGCGKTTLMSFLTYHYAQRQLRQITPKRLPPQEAAHDLLPDYDWLPITIVCRDLSDTEISAGLSGLIQHHLRQFGLRKEVQALTDFLEQQITEGRGLLLIDGLDEIPTDAQRRSFAKLIERQAKFYGQLPIVITSRTIGLDQIYASLSSLFSYFTVVPLEKLEQQQFIQAWAALKANSAQDALSIRTELEALICDNPKVARLCNTAFLLALAAQIYLQDRKLPDQIVDVYRRAVELMIECQRDGDRPPLIANEIYPHIEHLAYCMHSEGAQYWIERDVIDAIEAVRRQESRRRLATRTPEDWLDAVIQRLGLLNVAGTRLDSQGYINNLIQMFHQSFQEYFAAQAILHSRGDYNETEPLAHLRQRVHQLKIEQRKIEFIGSGQRTEPVIADQWEEVVRLCIDALCQEKAELQRLGIASADDAVRLLVPSPAMPAPRVRAFATFALNCLAENEPDVRSETVEAVLDAALDQINELERFVSSSNRGTALCEAFKAINRSRFGELCRQRSLQCYRQAQDYRRLNIGAVLLNLLEHEPLTQDNAAQVLTSFLEQVKVAASFEAAIETLLKLTETFFRSPENISLADDLLHEAIGELLTYVEIGTIGDEALSFTAMWALIWVLNAPSGSSQVYQFREMELDRLRQLARDGDRDAYVRAQAALLLGLYSTEKTVFAQTNWLYQWATVADGHKPHKKLPIAAAADRPKEIDTLKFLIVSDLPKEAKRTVALALGRLGCFIPEMVEPLTQVFQDDLSSQNSIDEAIVYLALTGGPEVSALFTQPNSNSEDSTSRSANLDELRSLGLIGLGNLAVLRSQFRLGGAADLIDLNAYAYVLAGVENPRGREILKSRVIQQEATLSEIANNALNKLNEWYASSQSQPSSEVIHGGNYVRQYFSKRGHLIHKLKAKDSTGRWAYYFVLVLPASEQSFMRALDSNESIDLENYGIVVASNYGEKPSEEVRAMLKERYDFDV